jgi:DNA modification methylase
MAKKKTAKKSIETLTHQEASRKNIPTAEVQSVMRKEEQNPIRVAYERRNRDLDPQLVWRGKDEQDWSDLVVQAPPLYIQEKVHPKVLIDDLIRQTEAQETAGIPKQLDLFADFNGLPDEARSTEFYQHDANWTNRMILGDSLQVMASLAEREGLRGKVQCIYFDPPYGIKFNSNFQWSTTSREVKDGKVDHITREPEQVKAFRDTWRDGIHSYLTYLRDRLTVARDLLTDSGSIFVQIGDENVHRVRTLMDEVFGEENFVSLITIQTTTGFLTNYLGNMSDFVLWFAKNKECGRSNPPFYRKDFVLGEGNARWLLFDDFSYRGVSVQEKRGVVPLPNGVFPYAPDNIISQGRSKEPQPFHFQGKTYDTWEKNSHWKANYPVGMKRLDKAGRIHGAKNSIRYIRFHTDFDAAVHGNIWTDTGSGNFTDDKVYVVQTNTKVIERCILMVTSPGDLVLDPTCGSGTTAYVAEQWGRRWITIDTSRVAGPFTVESLSPHRVLGVDENDELIDNVAESKIGYGEKPDFTQMILENLKTAGVQQAHKEDKINFSSITPWPGDLVCAEGRYFEGTKDTGTEKRAAIFIGPEFGTVSRPDLVAAAREAGDAGFDTLIACAFNYDAHSSEFDKLGRIPILKARMNADLHMADDLKNTGKGNLFVIFGEPDIDILDADDDQIQVKINGVDVFHPNTGEVRSDGAEGIACWFIDTDYNEESFFVRHAYFLGANDPYKALKTTLKAEINKEAWDTLHSEMSRPFDKPESGRIAVKVINHLGDEVMKVYKV